MLVGSSPWGKGRRSDCRLCGVLLEFDGHGLGQDGERGEEGFERRVSGYFGRPSGLLERY